MTGLITLSNLKQIEFQNYHRQPDNHAGHNCIEIAIEQAKTACFFSFMPVPRELAPLGHESGFPVAGESLLLESVRGDRSLKHGSNILILKQFFYQLQQALLVSLGRTFQRNESVHFV